MPVAEEKIADSELDTAMKLRAVDAFYWVDREDISLGGKPFLLKGHEYQIDWLQCNHPRQSFKKGAQVGATEIQVIKTVHGHVHGRYIQGTLYLFPTAGDVTDFSKGRFKPLIDDNPHQIGRYVTDTDAANIKRIGKGLLYFRGARQTGKIEGQKATSSKLKSIPVDRIVFDEKDEMTMAMIALALERIAHSTVQEVINVSTPSIPDYGIDKDYNESDQRVWIIKCKHCGTDVCLELDFPESLLEGPSGEVVRVCRRCKNEVHPRDGIWVPQYPSVTDHVGWWISQLNSIYVNPKSILNAFVNPPNGDLSEVYNSKLGMAYIAAENRLTPSDVYACCGTYVMPMSTDMTCAMGVDVGKKLHVVIGYPEASGRIRRILKTAIVDSFNDLHDLGSRFNVRACVIDGEPETRKAREFRKAANFPVFLCDYQERLKVGQRTDYKTGMLIVRRTEICDATHTRIASNMYVLPRRNPDIEQYALEMSNIAKVLEEDQETGSKKYAYRKLGPDHFRHATNYFELACNQPGLGRTVDPAKQLLEIAEGQMDDYDPLDQMRSG